ncbi:Na+/H+ antiporter subunit G [Thioclava sp.]|uniref:Na+/H+ antiporter subunit G n=1 Tax=Thioclava sp. TaxID=1933450 RepID=UPI003AA7BD6C
MELIWDIVISAFLVIGGIFGFVGSLGLVKLPDPMTRLHAPTKAATLGVGSILIASMIWFAVKQNHLSLHELMVTVFIFLTAPVTAHFISKANIFRDWPADKLPRPAGEGEWAVHQADADTSKEELAGEQVTESAQQD